MLQLVRKMIKIITFVVCPFFCLTVNNYHKFHTNVRVVNVAQAITLHLNYKWSSSSQIHFVLHVKIYHSGGALVTNPLSAICTDLHFLCIHTVHLFTVVMSHFIRIFTIAHATAYPLLHHT